MFPDGEAEHRRDIRVLCDIQPVIGEKQFRQPQRERTGHAVMDVTIDLDVGAREVLELRRVDVLHVRCAHG
ncbi:hypothetical protein BRC77_09950 [Halobacteriales archaeon QH_8_64_26]|nr:MAG: hypothetical protein BRC77_09950 [Halobacteriales archaeon QH_8_64_26]